MSSRPDPAAYAAKGTEHSNQVALMMWAASAETKAAYPLLRLLYAIPNGGLRDKISAARLKAEGVKSGVPDLFLPVARHGMYGLYIELKRLADKKLDIKKGRVSDAQAEWNFELRAQGYGVATCYGWEDAKSVLMEYLK